MTITRDELYKAVWKTPATKLAKTYNISDVALAKICKKLHVPKPGLGYWNRKAHGYRVYRPHLPKADCPVSVEIADKKPATAQVNAPELQHPNEARVKAALKSSGVQPATTLHGVSPTIRQLEAVLTKDGPGNSGRLGGRKDGGAEASFVVTDQVLGRALIILDALQKLFTAVGAPLAVTRRTEGKQARGFLIHTKIDQWSIEVQIAEQMLAIREEGRPWPTYKPTGRLRVKFPKIERIGARNTWRDGEIIRVEEQLREIVIGAFRAAHALEVDKAKLAERKRQWEENRLDRERAEADRKRAAEEIERLRRSEAERNAHLSSCAKTWADAQQIRAFVAACEEQLKSPTGQDNAAARWLDWARERAVQLNPLQKQEFVPTIVRLSP